MLSPTALWADRCGTADLRTVRCETCAIGTVAASVAVNAPEGPVAVPVARLRTDPAFRSDCVNKYVAVHVISAPGASVAGCAGLQDKAGRSESVTVTPVRV